MISFQPLFDQLKAKGLTIYRLEMTYGFNKSTLYKLKHNKNVEMIILDDLCKALNCRVEDLIVYVEDETDENAD